ncbi:unnamed protein product, partial [Closterium sp. NIES-54]
TSNGLTSDWSNGLTDDWRNGLTGDWRNGLTGDWSCWLLGGHPLQPPQTIPPQIHTPAATPLAPLPLHPPLVPLHRLQHVHPPSAAAAA